MGNTQTHTVGFDFETAPQKEGYNSFNPYHVTPLQLGAYSSTTGKSFNAIFRTTPAQAHLTSWHTKETPHLTPEVLANGQERCAIMKDFVSFLKEHPGKVTLVGYGSDAFDKPLLLRLMNECQEKMPHGVEFVDARDNFLRIYPSTPSGMKSGKLTDVCEYHHVDAKGKAHNAVVDAEMAAKLYDELNVFD